ncbi:hypothetical protein HGH92_24540 [Chitinophaga varians]|uniref:Uncharacterized protein n=1 Tax=Chitinophaga varians TaxID=2202339 RepID=A0A847RXF6_9BACT|nr:hypothetical protein [Chitinophaga varians]NLR67496.1 hypothetical protein [Chitinophaga varians]
MRKNGEMHKVHYSIIALVFCIIVSYFYPTNSVIANGKRGNDSLFFSYGTLQRKLLPFKKVVLPKFITNTKVIRPGSNTPNTLRISKESKTPLKITLYQHSLNWFDEKGIVEKDRIQLKGKTYLIDSIFSNPINERPLRLEMSAIYELSYNSKKFISMQFERPDFNGTGLQPWYILLCDITDLSHIKIYGLVTLNNNDESYQAPICIGDFNLDGNLEFAKWENYQNNEVKTYILKDGQCILQPYSLKIFELEKGNFYIDIQHSKWYFPLK